MNNDALSSLEELLLSKLQDGCDNAVEVIQANTPIDTKRLYTTTRTDEPIVDSDKLQINIVIGGEELAGILREQGIVKEVDYAIDVERRYQYIGRNLTEIENAIIEGFQ
jgi:hypothetical protein